jgi:rSAM/selenodomain-associated transferase 1
MPILKILDPKEPTPVAAGHCALGIMTKFPEPGTVKTRLTPPLTADEAAALNKSFLRDLGRSILVACREAQARGVAVYTPSGSEAGFSGFLPLGFFLLLQKGNTFGERLTNAAKDLFDVGFASVCLINSDSPLVPASSFAAAVKQLAKAGDRVVLGPSDDGGYYLIGMKKQHRHLFHNIDWSTSRVLAQTMRRASELGVPVNQLPAGFDVDDGATLRRLGKELLTGQTSAVAPSTQRFLKELLATGRHQHLAAN